MISFLFLIFYVLLNRVKALEIKRNFLILVKVFNPPLFHMSGVQESISCPSPNHPAGPFETQIAVPNRVLEGVACRTQPRRPFGLFCAAILLCDLRPLAARALTSRRDFVSSWRVPSRINSQSDVKNPKNQM